MFNKLKKRLAENKKDQLEALRMSLEAEARIRTDLFEKSLNLNTCSVCGKKSTEQMDYNGDGEVYMSMKSATASVNVFNPLICKDCKKKRDK